MFCPNCGVENPDTAAECRRCHVPFDVHEAPAEEAPAEVQAEAPAEAAPEEAHGEANAAGTICSRCETFNEPGVERCTTCGYPLVERKAAPGAAPEHHAEPHDDSPVAHEEHHEEHHLEHHEEAHAAPEAHHEEAPEELHGEPQAEEPTHDTPAEGSPSIADELSALELSPEDARAARGEDATPADGSPPVLPGAEPEVDQRTVALSLSDIKSEMKKSAPVLDEDDDEHTSVSPEPEFATPAPPARAASGSSPGVAARRGTVVPLPAPSTPPAPTAPPPVARRAPPAISTPPAASAPPPVVTPPIAPAVSAPPPAAAAEKKICPSCGEVNLPNAKFCAECGTPFKKAAAPTAPPPPAAPIAPAPVPTPPPSIVLHEDLAAHAEHHDEPAAEHQQEHHQAAAEHHEDAHEVHEVHEEHSEDHGSFDASKTDPSQKIEDEHTAEQAAVVVSEELAQHQEPEAHVDEHAHDADHPGGVAPLNLEGDHGRTSDLGPSVSIESMEAIEEHQPEAEALALELGEEHTQPGAHAPDAAVEEPEEVTEAAPEELSEAEAAPEAEPAPAEVAAPAPVEAPPYTVILVVEKGEHAGTAFHLAALENSIGSTGAVIELTDDAHLAPHHATVLFEAHRLLLRDEGSANGVYIKVRDAAALEAGDQFIAGQRLLRFDGNVELPGIEASDLPFQGAPRPQGSTVRVVELLMGGKQGRTCHRAGPVIAVGKSGCDMNFPSDELLASRHAEIHLSDDGSASLVDLGSATEGVLLRLRQGSTVELQAGDVLQMGSQTLRVELE